MTRNIPEGHTIVNNDSPEYVLGAFWPEFGNNYAKNYIYEIGNSNKKLFEDCLDSIMVYLDPKILHGDYKLKLKEGELFSLFHAKYYLQDFNIMKFIGIINSISKYNDLKKN